MLKNFLENWEEVLFKARHSLLIRLADNSDGQTQSLKQIVIEMRFARVLCSDGQPLSQLSHDFRQEGDHIFLQCRKAPHDRYYKQN